MRTHLKKLANIILCYPLNEGGGSTAYDFSGNLNNGTIFGASWATGAFGQALLFDGLNDCILVKSTDFISFKSLYTLETWVNWDGTLGNRFIYAEGTVAGPTFLFRLNAGKPQFGLRRQVEGWLFATATNPIPQDTWLHLTCTMSSEGMKVYDRGILVATNPNTLPTDFAITQTGIGRALGTPPSGIFTGLIDEFFIHDVALSLPDITIHSNRKELL